MITAYQSLGLREQLECRVVASISSGYAEPNYEAIATARQGADREISTCHLDPQCRPFYFRLVYQRARD